MDCRVRTFKQERYKEIYYGWYGTYVIEYEGNKYIVVRDTNCIAITPALTAKVEKE